MYTKVSAMNWSFLPRWTLCWALSLMLAFPPATLIDIGEARAAKAKADFDSPLNDGAGFNGGGFDGGEMDFDAGGMDFDGDF
jgi:hypothetical protein